MAACRDAIFLRRTKSMEILQSQFQKQWEHHSSCKQWALQKDAKARVICLMQEAEEHSYFSTEDQFLPDELQED